MKILLSIVFALTVQGGYAGLLADIPPAQQVALPGVWTPNPEETGKALRAAQAFLENPGEQPAWTQRQIADILAHAPGYRVQFIGVEEEGRLLIRCNFFPASREGAEDRFPQWRKEVIEVLDGGFWFWQIDYDVETGACRGLSINGEA
ncbi:MAG: hypothetical protein KA248_13940 [Kiritimatiellae bacterium]|nr:hypothetical protein [Kiritimatiellia bacterium]